METIKPKKIKIDEKTAKQMKAMREATCMFPVPDEETGAVKPCGEKQLMTVSLPVLRMTESGMLEEDQGMGIGLPFCNYHSFMVMGGFFGVVMKDGKPHHLHGDFGTVALVEHVINVQLTSGRLGKMLKEIDKAEKEAEKMFKKSKKSSGGKKK